MTHDEHWSAVTAAAMIGTARHPLRLDETGDALGSVMARIAAHESSSESKLLAAAATLWLYERAGTVAATAAVVVRDVVVVDSRRRVGERIAVLLERARAISQPHARNEWLMLAIAHGTRP